MTKQREDVDAGEALKKFKIKWIRAVENLTSKKWRDLLNEAGEASGDGLLTISLAVEAEMEAPADFDELLERAEDWSSETFEELDLSEGVEVDLGGDEKKLPPTLDIAGTAS